MPKNKLSDLHNHLFETLEALKDKENPMGSAEATEFFEQAGTGNLLVAGKGHGPLKRLA